MMAQVRFEGGVPKGIRFDEIGLQGFCNLPMQRKIVFAQLRPKIQTAQEHYKKGEGFHES